MLWLDFVSSCGGRPIFVGHFVELFAELVNDMVNEMKEVVEALRRILSRALYSSLGNSAGRAILFFLERNLRRDPFEVLWENPRTFYNVMERILGAGTKVLINILFIDVSREAGLNVKPEDFLELMCNGSVEEVQSILRKIAESCKSKEGCMK